MKIHPDLRPCEVEVENTSELQWRQVSKFALRKDGRLRPQAFKGTSEDILCISTSRSEKVTAQAAFEFHTKNLGLSSEGTWAVSVEEVQSCGARVVDDCDCPDVEVPGHSFLDFRHLETGEEMSKTKQLAQMGLLSTFAEDRGCQHSP